MSRRCLTMKPAAKAVFLPGLPALLKAAEWATVPAALMGGLVAALFGLVVGVPLMRLSGIAASIATFAVLSITYVVLGNWTSVTGGQNSLFGLPIYADLWAVLPWALVAVAAAFAYQETRSGLMLRASREDEVAAEASGIDVHRQRLYAFVLSAFFSGIAGVLYGHFLGVLRVESFYLDMTFLIVAMLVIGGMRSLLGAVAGALVISLLTELLRQLEVRRRAGRRHHRGAGGPGRRRAGARHAAHHPVPPPGHRRRPRAHLAVRRHPRGRPHPSDTVSGGDIR